MNDDARKNLVDVVRSFPRPLSDGYRGRCTGLLRDKCPEATREIFVLDLAWRELYLLTGEKSLGILLRIQRLADGLSKKFGIESALALWAAETWALALGEAAEDQITFSLSCPSCDLGTRAAANWKGRIAVCPRCKTQMSIDANGGASLCNGNMSRSVPSHVRWWLIIDQPKPETLQGVGLAREIERVLADGALTDEQKAEQIELRRSLAVLPDVAIETLRLSGSMLGSCESLILGILRGALPVPGLFVAPDISQSDAERLRGVVRMPPAEKILAVVDGGAFNGEAAIVFGAEGVYFRNPSSSAHPGTGGAAYHGFSSRTFTPAGLQELQLGDGDFLDLRATGISKRTMIGMLNSIKHVLANIGWGEKGRSR